MLTTYSTQMENLISVKSNSSIFSSINGTSLLLLLFPDGVSLCGSGWTQYVDQAALKLMEIHLPLPLSTGRHPYLLCLGMGGILMLSPSAKFWTFLSLKVLGFTFCSMGHRLFWGNSVEAAIKPGIQFSFWDSWPQHALEMALCPLTFIRAFIRTQLRHLWWPSSAISILSHWSMRLSLSVLHSLGCSLCEVSPPNR